LRGVLLRYPKAGLDADVAAEVHGLYQASLKRFADAAATADPSLLPLMSSMLDFLEASHNPAVEVHFSRPSTEQLVQLDERIAATGGAYQGRAVAPASMHFTQSSANARETRISAEIQQGFRSIFPNDVLAIVPVQISNPTRPQIEIKYEIGPSGKVYVPRDDPKKAFVGLEFRFAAAMSVPQRDDQWQFGLEIHPPEHFVVQYEFARNAPKVGPADSQVYAVMAERAFDELSVKLRAAFFKEGSAPANLGVQKPASKTV
jgi:hypothetical protein